MPKAKRGNCYHSSYLMVCSLVDSGMAASITLVHGTVFSRLLKKRIDHAWIELGTDVVFDPDNHWTGRKTTFYEIGKIAEDDIKRYDAMDALGLGLKYRHSGPWEEENVRN